MRRIVDHKANFFAKTTPEPNSGCLLWTAAMCSKGYGTYAVFRRVVSAHRFAWELANGEVPDGLCVLHRCDTPACVNIDHLFLGTHHDNALDKVAKGRAWRPRGEKNVKAKLTAANVEAIRSLHAGGYSRRDLSFMYQVTHAQIGAIVNQKSWKEAA